MRTDVVDDMGNLVILHPAVARRWDLLKLSLQWPGALAGVKNMSDRHKHEMLEALYTIFAFGRDDFVGRVWNLVDEILSAFLLVEVLDRGRGYILFGVGVVMKSLASE